MHILPLKTLLAVRLADLRKGGAPTQPEHGVKVRALALGVFERRLQLKDLRASVSRRGREETYLDVIAVPCDSTERQQRQQREH